MAGSSEKVFGNDPPLCSRCVDLTQADFVEVTPKKGSWGAGKRLFLPLETRTEESIAADERSFRLSWPTSRILDQAVHVEPTFGDGKTLFLHRTAQELDQCALASVPGCHLCYIVGVRFSPPLSDNREQIRAVPVLVLGRARDETSPVWQMVIRFIADRTFADDKDDKEGWLRFFDLMQMDESTVHAVRCPESGIRERTWRKLNKWIHTCGEGHTKCQSRWNHRSTLSGPSRMLEITASKDNYKIKLVPTKQLGELPRYAALSHCWGRKGVPVKLIQDNIDQWSQTIPYDILPRTFQEAMVATHRLGLGHLWIDALCIIQDSPSDWHQESSRMRDVYSGSAVTLAATASTDSNGGLFVQPTLPTSCVLEIKWLTGKFRFCESYTRLLRYIHEIEYSGLNYRGWVFQERALSTRLVHFARGEIWWECLEHRESENDEHEEIGRDGTSASGIYSTHSPAHLLSSGVDWTNLVTRYSINELTFETDRLIAFSGVAQAYAARLDLKPSDYLAGLWRPDLRGQLMWQQLMECRDTTDYIAPSWSWADASGHNNIVKWASFDRPSELWNPGFEIVHCETQLLSPASGPFGAVSDGHIIAKTLLLHAGNVKNPNLTIVGPGQLEDKRISKEVFKGKKLLWTYETSGFPDLYRPTHVVPMVLDKGSYGLLLLHRQEGQKGTYTRTDAAEIYRKGDEETMPAWWTEGVELEEGDYLENLGGGRYTIKII